MLPRPIQNFIETFSSIPSIGPRKARRLSFYITDLEEEKFQSLKQSFNKLEEIDKCPQCFFIKDKQNDLCRICSQEKRNDKIRALVEKETDILSIEKTGNYNGIYLIIGKSKGTGSLTEKQKSRLKYFKKKNSSDGLEELIIATNPNAQGDFLAQIVKKEMSDVAKKITRLGRGIPTGGEVEFADEETLSQALKRRS